MSSTSFQTAPLERTAGGFAKRERTRARDARRWSQLRSQTKTGSLCQGPLPGSDVRVEQRPELHDRLRADRGGTKRSAQRKSQISVLTGRKTEGDVKTFPMIFIAIALSFTLAACQPNSGDAPNTGQACHVVDGPNDGKQGRYDAEGACCDADESGEEVPGGWGCTECGGSNEGKCEDGPNPERPPGGDEPIANPDPAAPATPN